MCRSGTWFTAAEGMQEVSRHRTRLLLACCLDSGGDVSGLEEGGHIVDVSGLKEQTHMAKRQGKERVHEGDTLSSVVKALHFRDAAEGCKKGHKQQG